MNDLSVKKYREAFEQVMRDKAEDWGFNPDEELDYFQMTEEEQAEHPMRGDYYCYIKQSTERLFSIFCAGARSEELKQAEKKAKKKARKKFCSTPPMPEGFYEQRALEKRKRK